MKYNADVEYNYDDYVAYTLLVRGDLHTDLNKVRFLYVQIVKVPNTVNKVATLSSWRESSSCLTSIYVS